MDESKLSRNPSKQWNDTDASEAKGDDWDKLAKEYTKLTYETSLKPIGLMLERSNALLPFSEATGILDDGCGPGPIMSRILKDHGSDIPKECTLLCTDFSEPMLKQVESQKAAAAADSPWKRVDIKHQDATDLEAIEDNSMSHVTAGMVFFMTPDPLKCLTETRRVLKENGVAAISSWEGNQWMDIMKVMSEVDSAKQLPEIPSEWRSTSGVQGEMQKAGFRDTESHRVHVEMEFQTHESFVDFILAKIPHMITLTKGMSEAELAKLRESMVAKSKDMCPSEPGRFTGEAIVGVGKK